ncbi:hypothetical protein N7449_005014, partial [Penicillium cf. viridicatum]
MSPCSAMNWPEREEKNLLSWLDAHRELLWKAHPDAYYEQHRMARSAESLRGKRYHNLRKCRRTSVRSSDRSGNQKETKTVRRSVGRRASLATLPNKISAKSNIDKRFETIITAEASQTDSNESSQTKTPRTADLLSQVVRREYQSRVGLKKYDRHLGCGTMCIVFVQPGSLYSNEQNMLAA